MEKKKSKDNIGGDSGNGGGVSFPFTEHNSEEGNGKRDIKRVIHIIKESQCDGES